MNDKPETKIVAGDSLDVLCDAVSLASFGLTRTQALAQGVCINCRKAVKNEKGEWRASLFRTEAGKREYPISGLCEVCFDKIFDGEDDDNAF